MKRSAIPIIPDHFKKYTNLIPSDMTLVTAFDTYDKAYLDKELERYISLGDQIYAPNKWTIKQTFVHLSDTERIFAYRALRIARGDKTPIIGFAQDDYVASADVSNRTLENILMEYDTIRKSTRSLFASFDNEILVRTGVASGHEISVLALGFMICAHLVHHQNIIEERYYPLLKG